MTSLKIHDKSMMLIERGDVQILFVQGHRVRATVASFDGIDEYDVELYRGRWRCSCPSRRPCSHIHAVQLVTQQNLARRAVSGSCHTLVRELQKSTGQGAPTMTEEVTKHVNYYSTNDRP